MKTYLLIRSAGSPGPGYAGAFDENSSMCAEMLERARQSPDEMTVVMMETLGPLIVPIINAEIVVDARRALMLTIQAQQIISIISSQLGIPEHEVTSSSLLYDDLGADDLDKTEIIIALEENFCTEMSDEEAELIKTVGDAITWAATTII